MTLTAILERLKEATGPDATLDADIHLALFPDMLGINSGFEGVPLREAARRYREDDPEYWPVVTHTYDMTAITASIDAALGLVERLGFTIHTAHHGKSFWSVDVCVPDNAMLAEEGDGPTFPLAILTALVTALIARKEQQ